MLTSRERIDKLPEPFRTGVMTSNEWAKNHGRLGVTNCLSLYMPKGKDDVIVSLKVGFNSGWNICDTFGFGEELFLAT
jgi:hypothetical protein